MSTTTTLEDLSAAYDRAKSEFVSQTKAHADRSVLAVAARQAASAAQALNAEAYRKFHASEEDSWMPMRQMTGRTDALSELWIDLASAYEA